ncbi:MFS transporter [Dactylosporangium sp. CA-152071]|uniref:MFS transporter n=1 Tax=Dactylosporangium sp. CA-152071 TaxID=3239933 RepID=UPI003D8B9A53
MTTPDAPPKATGRQWLGLVVLCLPTMLATVDINITILALPRIAEDLGASSTEQLWIADVYGFFIAGFLITMGNLGDRIGRRKVLLGGAVLFIVASVLAAFAPSTEVLILCRALIGIAGATIMPSVLALIAVMFPNPKEMGAAMGAWGSSVMLGLIGGPIIGGLLLGSFWWGSVFLIAVPVMALLLLLGPALLPEFRNPHGGRLDLFSVLLSLAGITLFIYGVKEAGREGWNGVAILTIIAGLLFGAAFVWRQRTAASPLLDLSLFRIRSLSSGVSLGLLIAIVMGGVGLTASLFMQLVRDISPFRVALWLIIPSIAMVILGNVALAMAQKIRPAYILVAGSVLAIVGLLILSSVDVAGGMWALIGGLVLVYVGGSPVGMMNSFLVMSSAPPEKAGSAGAVSSTAGELGAALGVAILGVVASAVYRTDLTVPAGVGEAQADAARSGIAGAVYTAGEVPGAAGAELLRSAKESFTNGLHVVAFCAIALYVLMAAVSYFGLRHVPPTGSSAPPMTEPAEAAPAVPPAQPPHSPSVTA